MATTTEKVLLQFEVDATGAIRNVQQVDAAVKQVPRTAQEATSALSGMKQAMQMLGDVVAGSTIVSFLKSASQAAAEEDGVMARLNNTLRNAGAGFAVSGGQVQAFLANIQATTRFADDQAAGALNKLVGITGNYKASLEGMGAALNLASGRGMELEAAADLVGKAIAGNTLALGRYGVVLSDSQKEMLKHASATERAAFFAQLFQERFGGAAAADFATAGGQIASLTNNFGDLQEAIGRTINRVLFDPAIVQPLIGKLQQATTEVDRLRESGNFDAFKRDVAAVGNGISTFVGLLVKAAEGWSYLRSGAEVAITSVLGWLADLVTKLYDFEGSIIAVARDLADTFGADWLESALDKMIEGSAILRDSTALAAEGLHQQAQDAADELLRLGDRASAAADSVEDLGGAIEDVGDASRSAFGDLGRELSDLEGDVDGLLAQYREWDQTTDDLARSTEDFFADLPGFFDSAEQMWDQLIPPIDEIVDIPEDARTRMLSIWSALAEDLGRILQTGLSDGLMAAFSGDSEGILDAFSGVVQQMGTAMADSLIAALGTIGTTDSSGNRISFGDVMRTGGWQSLAGMAGSGLLAMGQQRSNSTMGAVGGAVSGASAWGAGWSIPVYGWIGGVISTIIGGVMGYLSSQAPDTPETRFSIGAGGVTGLDTANQGLGPAQWENFRRRATSAYRQTQTQYLDVLRLFEMPELFSQLGNLPSFSTGGMVEGSVDTWLQMLTQDVLPDIFMGWARGALGTGLSAYGVGAGTQEQLFEELAGTTGADRLAALQMFISAVVESSKLLDDLSWEAMTGEVGATSIEQFRSYMEETMTAIDTAFGGMADMDLVQRAQQAQDIEALITQARQTELQYLQQINQMQESVNRSIQQQIEGIQLGGMSDAERIRYGEGQIQDLMGQLASATAPEQIQFLVSEIQRYVGMVQGAVGDNLYTQWDIGNGMTWSEYLISILEQAQATANERFGVAEDEVRTANDALIEQLERLRDALGITADGLNEKFGGSGGTYTDALLAEMGATTAGGSAYADAMLAEMGAQTASTTTTLDRTAASIDRLVALLADRLPQTINVVVRAGSGGGSSRPQNVGGPIS